METSEVIFCGFLWIVATIAVGIIIFCVISCDMEFPEITITGNHTEIRCCKICTPFYYVDTNTTSYQTNYDLYHQLEINHTYIVELNSCSNYITYLIRDTTNGEP